MVWIDLEYYPGKLSSAKLRLDSITAPTILLREGYIYIAAGRDIGLKVKLWGKPQKICLQIV